MYDDTCPYCESMNVRAGELNPTTNRFQLFCRDCGKIWEDDE